MSFQGLIKLLIRIFGKINTLLPPKKTTFTQYSVPMDNILTDFILPTHWMLKTWYVISAAFTSNRVMACLSSQMQNASASNKDHEPSTHTAYFLSNASHMIFKDTRDIQVDARKVTLCWRHAQWGHSVINSFSGQVANFLHCVWSLHTTPLLALHNN